MEKKLNQDSKNSYSTPDIGLACSLVGLQFKLLGLEKNNPRSIKFVFKYDSGLDKAVNKYWNNELSMNPRNLLDNYRMLKKRLFNE